MNTEREGQNEVIRHICENAGISFEGFEAFVSCDKESPGDSDNIISYQSHLS